MQGKVSSLHQISLIFFNLQQKKKKDVHFGLNLPLENQVSLVDTILRINEFVEVFMWAPMKNFKTQLHCVASVQFYYSLQSEIYISLGEVLESYQTNSKYLD